MIQTEHPLQANNQRILIFNPNHEEALQAEHTLREAGLATLRLSDVGALCDAIRLGAGAVLLGAETLTEDTTRLLRQVLDCQPRWADLPILLLVHAKDESPALLTWLQPAVVTLLQRPLRGLPLVNGARAALQARRRQYELRDYLSELEHHQQALHESEERLELAISGSASGFWDIQLHSGAGRREVFLSPQQKAIIGYADHELENSLEAWRRHIPSSDQGHLRKALRASWRRGRFELEYRIRHRDGSIRWLLSRGRIVRDQQGRPVRWVGLDWDITERKHNEEELARLAAVVACSHDAIITITLDGTITGWNAAARRMYGYEEAEIVGRSLKVLTPPERMPDKEAVLRRLSRGEHIDLSETVRMRKDGGRLQVQRTISPVYDRDGNIMFASSIERDVTESKRLQARLRHEAFHDSLTGLPNRALFIDRLEHVIARAQRQQEYYAVLLLDLDNFKVINDSLGHIVGDELLKQFSARIAQCLRPSDTLARFGGDEFTILLEEMRGVGNVLQVVERIQNALTATFHLDGHDIKASTSIGIALNSKGYTDAGILLRDADTALYQAKAKGKNTYVIFDQPMREAAVARMRMENNLRTAIEQRRLGVHYQPIVDIGSGRIIGCEALARWHDPELGHVSPAEFIPIAEDSGLIIPLGKLVLETATEELARWRAAGIADGLYVSVNLSTRQIQQTDLADQIFSALARSGLCGHDLRLEITESIMMSSGLDATEILAALRARGICICMDDFGTGYSSLSYLREFPFDVLKIDKSFIQSIAEDSTTREIVRTVSRLADGLMVEAIAEGVETWEHLDALRNLGLRWAQGFHFYRALEASRMAALLRRNGNLHGAPGSGRPH